MAYQEALASNIPILAWDPGFWVDPQRELYESKPVPATSVPYFSSKCGERFKKIGEFEKSFERFWNNLPTYEPREYIKKHLSLDGSANIYMSYYSNIYKLNSSQDIK